MKYGLKIRRVRFKRSAVQRTNRCHPPYTIKIITEDIRDQQSLFDTEQEVKEEQKKKAEAVEKLKHELEIRYDELAKKAAEEYKENLSNEELEELSQMAWEEVKKQQGKNPFGLKTFHRLALNKKLIKLANFPDFKSWKDEQLKKHN